MIDPSVAWVELCTVPSGQADLVSDQVELAWLIRYPLPSKVVLYKRNEFKTIILAEYGISVKPITSRNPKANSIRKGSSKNRQYHTYIQSIRHEN